MRIPGAVVARAGWVALALALASCRLSAEAIADGDDPLAALAAPAESVRYDGPFWTREAHRNSRTWRAARAFCRQVRGREAPNCHAVELVERWEGAWGAGTPAALPPLPPPPPLPPALHPGDPGRPGADLAALKAATAAVPRELVPAPTARPPAPAASGPRRQRLREISAEAWFDPEAPDG